jgi:hypothetical protein
MTEKSKQGCKNKPSLSARDSHHRRLPRRRPNVHVHIGQGEAYGVAGGGRRENERQKGSEISPESESG